MKKFLITDGNEAASYIAYKTSEVCAIYPITPASPMGENVDQWSSDWVKNIWGTVPRVVELQSEGGAAGTVHGSLQTGALTTTFTASQGLLLMIPNMYKIAGELTSTVFHIASRSLAAQALSIFGDHQDVMATRATGWAMLFSSNVQEAMDMALIAHSVTLTSRIPFLHIFDGFRTSHEINKINRVEDDTIREMIDEDAVKAHRDRALSPDNPFIRGTSQNPDVYFQAREAVNNYYQAVPDQVEKAMDKFAKLTGRQYKLFTYTGAPDAERVVIIMGSGVDALKETVRWLNDKDEKVGVVNVHLYRPLKNEALLDAIPKTVRKIAVLDRTKEPGSPGEPLYLVVVNAINESRNLDTPWAHGLPTISGGRYGLSSKEFTPSMAKAIFAELNTDHPKNSFTIGINDDVSMSSLDYTNDLILEDRYEFRGLFYGLGSDGTVSANKNSIKIIGNTTDKFVQGYFVYDSRKAGSQTISHLRFGDHPINSSYLIQSANFIACHHFNFMFRYDILKEAVPGATFLLNSPFSKDEVWDQLPRKVQKEIIVKELKFYVIDATKVAEEVGMGSRINTILQTCFFAISGILPQEEAIKKIKAAIEKTYSAKGDQIIQLNYKAVDSAVAHLFEVDYPKKANSEILFTDPVSVNAPDFVKQVLGKAISGEGNELPVSAMPADGTYPSGSAAFEKRNIANKIPIWDAALCTQCNKCVVICPHAVIRAKIIDNDILKDAPSTYKSIKPIGKDFDGEKESYSLQVAVEDCTGCSLCTEYCPAISKDDPNHKAIDMMDKEPVKEAEIVNWDFFLKAPEVDRQRLNPVSVKGSQFLQPLFEFSGACAGCGETPYIKLVTQLFGDRMVVANATGCSSIYGGNLPTTPWAKNKDGRGPAWSNSLFEDNAEFGLGMRMATNQKRTMAFTELNKVAGIVGDELVKSIIETDELSEVGITTQRNNIEQLKSKLSGNTSPEAVRMLQLADELINKSIWIMGGDGWAYDIGYGGLDHVLASGENVNILVLDTEVYSNTGGQNSKATPLAAAAKFAVSGKSKPKKELAFQAIAYGNVYVAKIAMGAKDAHTVRAIHEANAFPGTSIIIAYTHCIAHGYDMAFGAKHQKKAVETGYWPLFRYNPEKEEGKRFSLDSKVPTIPLEEYLYTEGRFRSLIKKDKEHAAELLKLAEQDVKNVWHRLEMYKSL